MIKPLSYNDCLDEMYKLGRFGIKLGLETIQGILKNLGNPEKNIRTVHIAGTNGKGSIASYITSILRHAGLKTGLYTSPHLVRFNERFVINGEQVSDDDIVEAYHAIKAADTGERKATFFEIATAMGFYLFDKHEVEWGIIETGMGGRLDATNILSPEACVITNLSLEHTEYLGNTIEAIAREKGGIIKEKTPVVTGVGKGSALDILKSIAREKSAPLYQYTHDFKALTPDTGPGFDYHGIKATWKNIETLLPGKHQIDNSALALAACELIAQNASDEDKRLAFTEETVREGICRTVWPGRLETILTKPLTILDGAHNLEAAQNLGLYFNQALAQKDLTLVIGILDDKPFDEMLKALVPQAKRIIFTKADISRSLEPEVLQQAALRYNAHAETLIIKPVDQAIDHAVRTAGENDAICVAGSLYVVGEARHKLMTDLIQDTAGALS